MDRTILLFGVLILRFFKNHLNWFIGLCFGLTLLFNLSPHYYPTGQVGYVAFYLGLFLLANKHKGKKIPKNWIPILYGAFFLVLGILWTFVSVLSLISIFNKNLKYSKSLIIFAFIVYVFGIILENL